MKKYLQILKMSWQNTFAYRLSFIMWRFRRVIGLVGLYFFWVAVYKTNHQIGPYEVGHMITYILLVSVINALIFSSRSFQVAGDIGTGNLSRYLIRPVKYFGWMFFLDLGDKASNFLFLLVELPIFLLLFRPPFFIQTNSFYLICFLITLVFGVIIYFYLGLIISMFTFWYPEHNGWPIRFLFDVVMVFLSGGSFPLDILPVGIYQFMQLLPFTYLRFFPAKIYLGQLNAWQVFSGMGAMIVWTAVLVVLVRLIWQKGLKTYASEGI